MQSYPLNLAPGNSTAFQTKATRFVYEAGASVPVGGDSRLVVKPDNGNEIVLRGGQSFKLPEGQEAAIWNVKAYDSTQTVTGNIIIGSGEFEDNSFKIDANSGAVPVIPQGGWVVANDVAHRVPVTLDTTQIIRVGSPIMKFTDSFYQNAYAFMAGATKLIDPAKNVNGIVLTRADMDYVVGTTSVAGNYSVLTKASAPTGIYDGNVFYASPLPYNTSNSFSAGYKNYTDAGRIDAWLIPPGQGLWIYSTMNGTASRMGLLFEVL